VLEALQGVLVAAVVGPLVVVLHHEELDLTRNSQNVHSSSDDFEVVPFGINLEQEDPPGGAHRDDALESRDLAGSDDLGELVLVSSVVDAALKEEVVQGD
jgi:hypothetical protein